VPAGTSPSYRDLHRLACWLLERRDGEHHSASKEFAVWPLLPAAEGLMTWRLHTLDSDGQRAARLRSRLGHGPRLGDVPVDVVDLEDDDVSYERLSHSRPRERWDLQFVSPTYFSRNGRDYLLPDAELLVRTAAYRWNSHSPASLAVGSGAVDHLAGRVVVSAHDIHTVVIPRWHGGGRRGFLGWVQLAVRGSDHEAATLLARLVAFLGYAGAGAGTTHGLGALLVCKSGD
jgi:CRISPR-associated endoribonuclease Cas6